MIVVKEFTFESAHYLSGYDGKCSNLHGHTYTLEVAVEGEVKENGMVIDFKELSDIVKENILDNLDHVLLNDIIDNPTAENTAKYAWDNLKDKLNLKYIKLAESDKSFVVYEGK